MNRLTKVVSKGTKFEEAFRPCWIDEIKSNNDKKEVVDILEKLCSIENIEEELGIDLVALFNDKSFCLKNDFKKTDSKKTVGDLTCDEIEACSKCPLGGINCGYSSIRTIRSQWEEALEEYPKLESMRKYVEKELAKEVKSDDETR